MTSTLYRMLASAGLVLGLTPVVVSAQQATTVSGRVTNEASAPVPGASVSIPSLGVGTYTTNDGRYTGRLSTPPLVGEARAAWLRAHAATHGTDLKRSYVYADSHSDLPLLRAVGNPVAVNPDVALFRAATRRRWPVEDWHPSGGTPRVLVPEAAR